MGNFDWLMVINSEKPKRVTITVTPEGMAYKGLLEQHAGKTVTEEDFVKTMFAAGLTQFASQMNNEET